MTPSPKYKIERITPHIYSVHIPNKYDRAMTFCRAQEFYESPNPDFQGKAFSIWEYIKWYSHETGKGFTYGFDWTGFNIPIKEIKRCYKLLNQSYGSRYITEETEYDRALLSITDQLTKTFKVSPEKLEKSYLIGVDGAINSTFKHEVCHGLYSTNKKYKSIATKLLKELKLNDPDDYKTFESNLLKMGYTASLVDDEIQAYLQFGFEESQFGNGACMEKRRLLNKKYRKDLYDAFQKK